MEVLVLLGLVVLLLLGLCLLEHLIMLPVRVLLQGQVIPVHHVLVEFLILRILSGVFHLLHVPLVDVLLVGSWGISLGSVLPTILLPLALMLPR
jgi:hypothetical protein